MQLHVFIVWNLEYYQLETCLMADTRNIEIKLVHYP